MGLQLMDNRDYPREPEDPCRQHDSTEVQMCRMAHESNLYPRSALGRRYHSGRSRSLSSVTGATR